MFRFLVFFREKSAVQTSERASIAAIALFNVCIRQASIGSLICKRCRMLVRQLWTVKSNTVFCHLLLSSSSLVTKTIGGCQLMAIVIFDHNRVGHPQFVLHSQRVYLGWGVDSGWTQHQHRLLFSLLLPIDRSADVNKCTWNNPIIKLCAERTLVADASLCAALFIKSGRYHQSTCVHTHTHTHIDAVTNRNARSSYYVKFKWIVIRRIALELRMSRAHAHKPHTNEIRMVMDMFDVLRCWMREA